MCEFELQKRTHRTNKIQTKQWTISMSCRLAANDLWMRAFLRILRMRALAHTHATHVVRLSMHTEKKVCVRDREINVDILLFIVVDFSGFLRRRSPDLCQQVSLYACVHYRTRTRITDKTLCIALHWIALYFRGWISINTQYTHTHTERANLFNFDFNFNSSFSPSLFFPYSISVSFHSLQ